MFAICIQAPENGSAALTADVEATGPYAFQVDWEHGWIAGESVGPVDDVALCRLADDAGALDLPPPILGLVIADRRRGRVVAAASVRSARPYYLHHGKRSLTLATSLATLRRLGVPLEADERRYGEVLVYRFVAPPNTLVKNVRRLVGGEVVTADLTSSRGLQSRLPVFPGPDPDGSHDEGADLDGLREALLADVRMEVAGRSKPGVLLSGGLDSGLLAALARHAVDGLESWSSSFDFLESGDGEAAYAQSMADTLGVSHHVHRGDATSYLRSLVYGTLHAETPLHHLQSGMLALLFARAAEAGHDALLCGEGADGMFGTVVHKKLRKYRHLIPWVERLGLNAAVRAGMRLTHSESQRWSWFTHAFGKDVSDPHHLLWTLGAYGDPHLVQERFGYSREEILGARRHLYETYKHLDLSQQVSISSLLLEASTTMVIWGRLAEEQGVALPCPFTGPATLEAVTRIPWRARLVEPKHHVRALLRLEGVAESMIERPKLSFGFPYRHWAPPGALFQPLVDLAGSLFDPALLRSLQSERWNEAMILWSALGLYLFDRLVVHGEDAGALADEVVARHEAAR